MDNNQAKVLELMREVHSLTVKEIERLNLRIAELETVNRQMLELRKAEMESANRQTWKPIGGPIKGKAFPELPALVLKQPDVAILNERQVASYLNLSLASIRRWRLLRQGPKYLKIGAAIRYRREHLERWLDSQAVARSGLA